MMMAARAAGGIWRRMRASAGGTVAMRWAKARNDARMA